MPHEYLIDGERAIIYAYSKGIRKEIIIDVEDLESVLEKGTWHIRAGHNTCYASSKQRAGGKPSGLLLHRFLLNPPPDMVVDHINHNGLDNRRCNIRIVTQAVNMQNRSGPPSNNVTGFRGVGPSKKRGKWKGKFAANATKDGKRYKLGHYTNIIDADAAIKMFWETGKTTKSCDDERKEYEDSHAVFSVDFDVRSEKFKLYLMLVFRRFCLGSFSDKESAYRSAVRFASSRWDKND